MNVFIHQNNETVGPFDENALREMLDSGQILMLTFARLEGESGWRPLSEIMTAKEKPAAKAAAAPALASPPQIRRPPPLVHEVAKPRETPRPATAPETAPPPLEPQAPAQIKIACPACGQHILVDPSFAGMTGSCPTCGGPVVIPATVPALPAQPAAHPHSSTPPPLEEDYGAPRKKGNFVRNLTRIEPVREFRIPHLFADVFKNRTRADYDTLFSSGSPATTPDPAALGTELPRPWFYLRMLILGGLVLFALCFGYEKFPDPRFLPELMLGAAFLIPFSCVALFFELNTPRNISVYQVLKLIVGGAMISLPVALFLSRHTNPTFLGTLCAGLLVDLAQTLMAVVLLRGWYQYRWVLNGLLAGAAVAAGIAGVESGSYMPYAFADSTLSMFYSVLANQMGYGFVPLCHVLWVAILVGALWRAKGDEPYAITMFFKPAFLRIFALVAVLEALWNSGLLWTSIGKFSLVRVEQGLWVVSVIGTCWLAWLMIHMGLRQMREGESTAELPPEPLPAAETVE
ncbi:MAG TPA: GYF domain-containing protein [Chthoniobacteraceae bacterium]|nr:GYF domain-containing protein [Chthoniobacteraceae bacterium]